MATKLMTVIVLLVLAVALGVSLYSNEAIVRENQNLRESEHTLKNKMRRDSIEYSREIEYWRERCRYYISVSDSLWVQNQIKDSHPSVLPKPWLGGFGGN